MKSSVGVTICGVLALIGSSLWLIGSIGMALMFAGPLGKQLFDPANLPPGADLRMMRAVMMSGALIVGSFGALGVATGIGLIRLWKWSRYSAIGLGVLVILLTLPFGIFVLFAPIPPPSSSPAGVVPVGFRVLLASFYFVWSAAAGFFVYMMMRKSTVTQFNGGVLETAPRARPLSVSIIAWYMIVSAALGLPMMALAHLPAFALGLLMSGGLAKAYYIVFFSLSVLLGIGLLKRTSEAMAPSIGFHVYAIANALVMAVPSVWMRYQQAIQSTSMFGVPPPDQSAAQVGRYVGVGAGVLVPGIILFFLLRARRTLAAASHQ